MIQAMDEQPVTCRRCTECIGEEHHYMDDCVNDAGEPVDPFFRCKHCPYTCAAVDCEACGDLVPIDIVDEVNGAVVCAMCRQET